MGTIFPEEFLPEGRTLRFLHVRDVPVHYIEEVVYQCFLVLDESPYTVKLYCELQEVLFLFGCFSKTPAMHVNPCLHSLHCCPGFRKIHCSAQVDIRPVHDGPKEILFHLHCSLFYLHDGGLLGLGYSFSWFPFFTRRPGFVIFQQRARKAPPLQESADLLYA
ncbi:MAG: hypothetical protein A2064_13160 [Spirochaetes bacterium GWB1_66_5]|nr:MAG: hypothetical protein A2064_13160 [Spirochaetes bacterium GWB1_66_5]